MYGRSRQRWRRRFRRLEAIARGLALLLALVTLVQVEPAQSVEDDSGTESGGDHPLAQDRRHHPGDRRGDDEASTYAVQRSKHTS